MLISFIIIGRNEGRFLGRCFTSIFAMVKRAGIEDYEIIYVDSNSSDQSIEVAAGFPKIKTLQLTTVYNQSMGRNLGAGHASGKYFFFADGDMEFRHDFLVKILDENKKPVHDFISGYHADKYYDHDGNLIGEGKFNLPGGDKYIAETGGTFIIKAEYWKKLNGMKNRLKVSEDIDIALRMSRIGILLCKKNEEMSWHHTISYHDRKRRWQTLLNKNYFYAKGVLYRMHILNKYIYKRILKHDPTLVILIVSIIVSFALGSWLYMIFYPLFVILRVILSRSKGFIDKLLDIPFFIFRDIQALFAFLFFYPAEISEDKIPFKILKN